MGAGDWAEDAAQEAFVSAWHALDRFAEDRRFRPWLVAIVVNEVRNRQRLWRRREIIVQRVGGRLGLQEPLPSDEGAEQVERRRRPRGGGARGAGEERGGGGVPLFLGGAQGGT